MHLNNGAAVMTNTGDGVQKKVFANLLQDMPEVRSTFLSYFFVVAWVWSDDSCCMHVLH